MPTAPVPDAHRDLDFAGFAQEFLRRNAAYRAEYAQLARLSSRGDAPAAREVMARRWALRFPVRA